MKLTEKIRAGLIIAERYDECDVEYVPCMALRGGKMVPTGKTLVRFTPRAQVKREVA